MVLSCDIIDHVMCKSSPACFKINIWSITQVVEESGLENRQAGNSGASVRITHAPPLGRDVHGRDYAARRFAHLMSPNPSKGSAPSLKFLDDASG